MKTLFIALAVAFCGSAASAQEEVVAGRSYELTLDVPVRKVSIDGQELVPAAATISSPTPPSRFTIIRFKDDYAIVRFWSYADSTEDYKTYNEGTPYFAVDRAVLSRAAIPFHDWERPSLSAGAILIPVKIRTKPFDFSKDITLGPSLAARMRTSRYEDRFLNLVLSFGLTSVQLDSASTRGAVPQPLDVTAVTPALGVVYEVDGFQLGAFIGWDMVSDNDRLKWREQGHRWFSVGLGYSIFSRNTSGQARSGKQPD